MPTLALKGTSNRNLKSADFVDGPMRLNVKASTSIYAFVASRLLDRPGAKRHIHESFSKSANLTMCCN